MKIINDLNIKKQAKELGISVWYTPSFLFLVMGILSIVLMTSIYFISKNYDNPEVLVVAESFAVAMIFIVGTSIIKGVEQVARINRMKSEFISVASHQLRTPLSAIKWETEIFLSKYNKGLTQKQLASVENVRVLTFRMSKLVNDLLDVARIEQGRFILKREKVDFVAMVKGAIKEYNSLLKSKNVRLVLKEKKRLPKFWGDPEKIRLVLDNLIGNAIKYISQRGKIEIEIGKIQGFAVFSIKDNGVGIPLEQQKHIFDKFFRSDNAVKYQTDGTGLGLFISKNIVEQSGGKIWFESKEEVGSIFSFSIPLINKK